MEEADQNKNDGKRAKKMFSDGFPIDDYKYPDLGYDNIFSNPYKFDESRVKLTIDIALLTDEIIDKAEINISIEDNVDISLQNSNKEYSDEPLAFDIDKLMDKLHGITSLNIFGLHENVVITRPPTTIIDFYNNDSIATVDFMKCINLRSYTLNGNFSDLDEINYFPDLPDGIIYVAVVCDYVIKSSDISRLPASVTHLIIDCPIDSSMDEYLNISNWPISLKYLKIANTNSNIICSMLPHNLEEIIIEMEELNTSIDFPPNLKELHFYVEQEYHHTLVIPYSVETLIINYSAYPNFTTLPTNCKTFYYQDCPDNILDGFKEKYPHVNLDS